MAFREFQLADYDQVAALWRAAGISLSAGDDEPGLARKLERDPELFFVAEEHGAIVGVVMACMLAACAAESERDLGLPIGAKAPDFRLVDQTGKARSLASLLEQGKLEQGKLAILFYRSADW